MSRPDLPRRLPSQRPRLSDLRLLPMVQTGHDNGAVHLHAIPDAVFELAKVSPSNVFDDRRVLVGILADARHGFVDALQELITEAPLPRIVPFAGLLDVKGGQRREANRMRQRGDGEAGGAPSDPPAPLPTDARPSR